MPAMPSPPPLPSGVGFCGKLPDRGDFVRRRLPQELVRGWEAWLDAGLTAGRAALGAGSPALLMNAPIWRFAASLPRTGAGGLAGVMMPSIDKVGRHYPLSVIAVLDTPQAAIAAALWSQHWFYDIERVALAALLGELSFGAFDARLASASGPDGPGVIPSGAASRRATSPLGLPSALIDRLSRPRPAAFSLWWSGGRGGIQGDGREFCLMFPGLPGPDAFPRLLTPAADSGAGSDAAGM